MFNCCSSQQQNYYSYIKVLRGRNSAKEIITCRSPISCNKSDLLKPFCNKAKLLPAVEINHSLNAWLNWKEREGSFQRHQTREENKPRELRA